jgi:hypothetical protein
MPARADQQPLQFQSSTTDCFRTACNPSDFIPGVGIRVMLNKQ